MTVIYWFLSELSGFDTRGSSSPSLFMIIVEAIGCVIEKAYVGGFIIRLGREKLRQGQRRGLSFFIFAYDTRVF